eukprot:1861793-Rhodomonas_salina.1
MAWREGWRRVEEIEVGEKGWTCGWTMGVMAGQWGDMCEVTVRLLELEVAVREGGTRMDAVRAGEMSLEERKGEGGCRACQWMVGVREKSDIRRGNVLSWSREIG